MANYSGQARTNYFRVTEAAAYAAFLAKWDLVPLRPAPDEAGRVGFTTDPYGDGGWPSEPTLDWCEAQEPAVDPDTYSGPWLIQDLAACLAPDEVAIGMEIGFEKLRYLVGDAWAVNAAGEKRSLSLDAIMDLAGELGANVTEPTY